MKHNEEEIIYEDELNLRELFKTIWEKRILIILFTGFFTLIGILYSFIKTPIYEAKAVIKIGYIKDDQLVSSKLLVKKLNLIYTEKEIETEKAIVFNSSIVKGSPELIEITTQAFSNEKAIEKIEQVVDFIKKEYENKIDDYKFKVNLKIEDLKAKIVHINTTKIKNLEQEINTLKNIEIVSIENKLKMNKEKLNEYQDNINLISKKRFETDTQNMLSVMEVINYQSLILTLKNEIEDLEKSKLIILNETIKKLQIKITNDLKNEIKQIKNSIDIEKFNLKETRLKNSHILGQVILNDYPKTPNKKLIISITFITSFILSIFLVFLMKFFRDFKEGKYD